LLYNNANINIVNRNVCQYEYSRVADDDGTIIIVLIVIVIITVIIK